MTLLRPDIRGRLFLRVKDLGGKRVAQDIDSDGIVDSIFQSSEAADGDFQGAIMYRPNVAAVDQLRVAALTDGPKLVHDGTAYADTTDLDYELYYQLHPYVINELIREAPHEVYGEVMVPLTIWPDGDLFTAGVAHWNSGTIAAPTKSSDTQYKLFANQRTLLVTTAGGNLYAQSDDVVVEPGDTLFHAAIGSLAPTSAAGECYYALWDETNNEAIYEASFTSYRDQVIRRSDVIPEGCYKVAIRAGGTTNGLITAWKGFPSHLQGDHTSPVQSWLKEQMNLLGFGPMSYGRSTGTDRFNASDHVYTSWDLHDGNYGLQPFVPASDLYTLQINRDGGLQGEDYWIHGFRRMSDIQEELDDEAAGSDIDEEMLLTAAICLVTAQLGPEYRDQYLACQSKLAAQRFARPVSQPKRENGVTIVGMRGGGARGRRW